MSETPPGGKAFGAITGVNIRAGATAWPEPLEMQGQTIPSLHNLDIFKHLLGPNYEQILATRDMHPDYPEQVVGLSQRQWTHVVGTPPNHSEEHSVDLGVKAVQALFAQTGLGPEDVGLLLFASTTPHKITSASSCAVGAATGIKAPSLDLKAGCSTGLYALVTAALYVQAGLGPVLLVAAETPSKYANPQIPETVMGVGDGAIALWLEKGSPEQGLLGGYLGADGELGVLVNTPGLLPPTAEALEQKQYYYHGDASSLKEAVPVRYLAAMQGALAQAGLTPSDLDLYVPHQVNRQLTRKVAELLGIPLEKQFHNLDRHGSVAGAAVLIALWEAMQAGQIQPGARVGLNTVGGGLTWGGLVWQF
ncbi:MAG: ketoacyl-ACP synthase III [Candidatus Sericytochromatia bacterium]|nr:ketoacyl-ACP synthase III [Candidatus Sericytochromatia bacterium]